MTENITVTITTPSDREAVVTREFNAPAGLVFDALDEAGSHQALVRPAGIDRAVRKRCAAGGSWRFVSNVRGKQIVQYGVYKEVAAPHRFVRTERWEDWDPGETLVTVDLVVRNGKTTMTQSIVFPSQEVRDVVMKGGLTPKGTSEFYERLDALLGSMA